jgi:predicted DNA repair protein MutK
MAKDRWSLRNIYLYLVCLITLIMVIVAVVGLVRSTVELLYPDPGYYMAEPVKGEDRSAEDIEKEREYQLASSRRYAVLNLVGNVAMLLVAGPLYVYHWRKIEVEHTTATDVTPAGV